MDNPYSRKIIVERIFLNLEHDEKIGFEHLQDTMLLDEKDFDTIRSIDNWDSCKVIDNNNLYYLTFRITLQNESDIIVTIPEQKRSPDGTPILLTYYKTPFEKITSIEETTQAIETFLRNESFIYSTTLSIAYEAESAVTRTLEQSPEVNHV